MKAQEALTAKDLRIGNLVNCFSDSSIFPIKDHAILAGDLVDLWSGEMEKRGIEVRGIPLTQEWLFKFGFVDDGKIWFGREGDTDRERIMLFRDDTIKDGFCMMWGGSHVMHQIYVHQFQNIFFALTGNELLITDTK